MCARTVIGLIVVAVLAAGCRVDVDTTVAFRTNDTADVTVSAGFDASLARRLDALGVDPFAAFAQVREFDWQLERHVDDSGLLRLGLSRDGVKITEIADVLASLSSGIRDTDVGLVFDVAVEKDDDLRTLTGTALFTPPTTQGVLLDGVALGLPAELIAEQIARDVTVWFTVRVDGEIVSHNADEADTKQVRWRLAVNEPVMLNVTVAPARHTDGALTAVLMAFTLVGGAVWLVWRRRHRNEPTEPSGGNTPVARDG
ncbi:MAG: hypothetical protein WD360_06035 [Nitriliruptoraceae bacterium]